MKRRSRIFSLKPRGKRVLHGAIGEFINKNTGISKNL
jgi:Na+-transporting NADH:ubiquinone oxidoreductase subunit NqrF